MEIPFSAKTIDGSTKDFLINDVSIDYASLRKDIEEPHLMYLIDQIKKLSGKKCAIIFGNCQMPMIAKFLVNNMEFRKKYFIIDLPAIFAYEKDDPVFTGGGWTILTDGRYFYNSKSSRDESIWRSFLNSEHAQKYS